jgi:hypothetical protein
VHHLIDINLPPSQIQFLQRNTIWK